MGLGMRVVAARTRDQNFHNKASYSHIRITILIVIRIHFDLFHFCGKQLPVPLPRFAENVHGLQRSATH